MSEHEPHSLDAAVASAEQSPASASAGNGPGQLLAAQRQAMGLTIEQAASQLNLAPRQILALESDDYAKLPGMASVRGFVRSYAKLLRLDAEPLVAMIAHLGASPLPEPVSQRRALSAPFFDDSRMPAIGVQGPSQKTNLILPAVIVVVVLLLFAGYQLGLVQMPNLAPRAHEEQVAAPSIAVEPAPAAAEPAAPVAAATETAAPAASVPQDAGVTPVALTAASPAAPAGAPAAAESKPAAAPAATPSPAPAPAKAESAKAESPKADSAKAAPATATAQPAAKPAEPAATVAPANKGALVIKFSEDTWIDLRKLNAVGPDAVVVSRIAKAGSTEAFDVTGEMALTVGNVAGVESASLRGSALDYKGAAKNNVSRITLK